MSERPKVGVAFGGGAARGLAHLGVMRTFERHGIGIDIVAGSSIGAVIGTLYAINPSADYVYARMLELLSSDLFREMSFGFLKRQVKEKRGFIANMGGLWKKGQFIMASFVDKGYVSSERYQSIIEGLVPDIAFESLRRPLAIVATDITESREVIFTTGRLRIAVAASSAIPGVVEPIKFDGSELVDGGWANNVPVRALGDLGAAIKIGVNVAEEWGNDADLGTGLEIFNRANNVSREILNRILMTEADVLITPWTSDIHWTDYARFEEIIRRGEEEAETKIGAIVKLIEAKQG